MFARLCVESDITATAEYIHHQIDICRKPLLYLPDNAVFISYIIHRHFYVLHSFLPKNLGSKDLVKKSALVVIAYLCLLQPLVQVEYMSHVRILRFSIQLPLADDPFCP